MLNDRLQPLPTLTLPVALVRFWPAAGQEDATTAWIRAIANYPGLALLREHLLAVMPTAGQAAVFDTALQLCQALLTTLRRDSEGSELAGGLIFPGRVTFHPEHFELLSESFLNDLETRTPTFDLSPQGPGQGGEILASGYASCWLDGKHRFEKAGFYDGPSGRRVPLARVVGPREQPRSIHNLAILGRKRTAPRPEVQEALEAAGQHPACRMEGPLGSGKSRAVWHFLDQQPGTKISISLEGSLPGTASLTRRLIQKLNEHAPQAIPRDGAEGLRRPEIMPPPHAARLLATWLRQAADAADELLWLVCDDLQAGNTDDHSLLQRLLEQPALEEGIRILLLSRPRRLASGTADLPKVEVPPMSEVDMEAFTTPLFKSLDMPKEVQERFLEAAAGFPLAFEEGLAQLVRRRHVRQVYGSFFFKGSLDTPYEPSEHLVYNLESEIRSLGDPLPMRILAAAGQAIPAHCLAATSETYGVELERQWQDQHLEAGLLRETDSPWGPALEFTCPAYAATLVSPIQEEDLAGLRRTLGQLLLDQSPKKDTAWQAYQLLAGSPEALVPLIDLQRQGGGGEDVAAEDLYAALRAEYRSFTERGGDDATELDLLWALLPLGRRLGRLNELEVEVQKAVKLAADQPSRLLALTTLKAELDQEQGRYREAENGFRQALALSEHSAPQRRAILFLRLGRLLLLRRRLQEAQDVFRTLLGIVDQNRSTPLGANCNFYLGNIALLEHRLDEAKAHHELALEVRQEHKLLKAAGASMSALGAVALAQGDYPSALETYGQAEKFFAAQDEPMERSYALIGLGRALTLLGDYTGATKPLRDALELREAAGDKTGQAIARIEVAANHLDLGQADRALEEVRRAHFDLSMEPESSHLGDSAQLLGRVLLKRKEYEEASQHFQEAERLHRKYGDPRSAAIDRSWRLRLGVANQSSAEIRAHSQALDSLLEDLTQPLLGERLNFRLYEGYEWLRERGTPMKDPLRYLRRAHRELFRKTEYLTGGLRHTFLFNTPEHQAILRQVAHHKLELPGETAPADLPS